MGSLSGYSYPCDTLPFLPRNNGNRKFFRIALHRNGVAEYSLERLVAPPTLGAFLRILGDKYPWRA